MNQICTFISLLCAAFFTGFVSAYADETFKAGHEDDHFQGMYQSGFEVSRLYLAGAMKFGALQVHQMQSGGKYLEEWANGGFTYT